MRKVSLRTIAAHKLRLALTVLAVVLGTAFISGAFMFTNSLSSTFDSAVNNAYRGVDAVVSAGEGQPGVSTETREAITADGQVDRVNLNASTTVVVATGEGEPIQTGGGTSSLSVWYPPEERVGQAEPIVEGEAPGSVDEVAVNAAAAERFGVGVGDTLTVVDPQARHEVTVTGLFDNELDQGGSLILYMPEADYLERYTDGEYVDQLIIDGSDDVSAEDLVADLREQHPDTTVETGQTLADETSELVSQALSFVNYFLVAFGLVALLVGTFLIANTFSMIVAQRTKEFALLRALGAARREITRSVVFEAVIVGLVGSALGVLAGMGLVSAIQAVLDAQGMSLPDAGLGLTPTAVILPIVLGTLVTVVSAWFPARRAGEVEPVEAMRSTESAAGSPLKVRTIIGAVLIVAGAAAALAGALLDDSGTGTRASLVGVGAVGVIVGFFFAGPAFSLPVVPTLGRVIGAPFGAVGRLASTNSRRNPRRTSATAFALTLGIALVTAIGMLGETMKASISDVFENNVTADYVLSGPTSGNFPTPAEVPQAARDTEGVGEVLTMSTAPVTVDGVATYQFGGGGTTGVIDGNPESMATTTVREGTADIGEAGVLASTVFADAVGWEVGDTFELAAPGLSPETTEVEVVGIFEPNNILDNMMVSQDAVEEIVPTGALTVSMVGVNGDGSVPEDQLRTNLEESVSDFIVVQVMSTEEMAGQAGQAIDQMLNILYALLALAVIIAVLGIVNTLTLNVIERRQEIGMLRAVGTQRGQVRMMITLEAVQIAVFGAVMGMIIGLGLGWAFLTVLAGEGLDTISVPIGQLLWMLLASAVVGVVAALWPAHRAAKTPPLDAIAD
ncbi:ABC transport system, permease [Corynebacterium halotolerans YIM 70093 = DSM 44683]|uniref:ABC transport system, permease n=2 Tax=Corynebacterium halotolerans TaxID=225326 RepID=M1NPM9_9CORY|nr:ABC transport system, permease [Corynebacterium halotolerans YIM 70093 = DSM 44683]